ncbi:MAG: hypothetical protein WC628_05030 [Candidatus Omnitrophota bacterium]
MKLIISTFFVLAFVLNCYALDWISLHEKADKIGLSEAAQSQPGSIDELYVLGLVYLNAHRDNQASKVFKRMLAQDPNLIEAKWGEAEVLRRQHRLGQSEEILKEVIKTLPDFSPARLSLAYVEYLLGDFTQASESAAFVIKQGRKKVDLSNFTRAYTLYAGSKGMVANQGGFLSKMINVTAVFNNLKKAQQLQPDSSTALFGLGSYYLLAPPFVGKDLDKAVDYLQKALQAEPGFVNIYVRLAQAYKAKNDDIKYQQYLDKAASIDPQNELLLEVKSGKCKYLCVD